MSKKHFRLFLQCGICKKLISSMSQRSTKSGRARDLCCTIFMEGNELAVCTGHEKFVTSLSATTDRRIVSGSWDHTIRVWNIEGKQLAVCWGHEKEVNSVSVTSDQRIVSGSDDLTVRVWNYWLVRFLKSMLITTEKSEKMWTHLQNYALSNLNTEACLNALRALLHEGTQPAAQQSAGGAVSSITSTLT